MSKNVLITGKPGRGKTTLFRRLVDTLRHLEPVGFYTQEIREGGVRKGFTLNGSDGCDRRSNHKSAEVHGENFLLRRPYG